jgi:hypothetical protein
MNVVSAVTKCTSVANEAHDKWILKMRLFAGVGIMAKQRVTETLKQRDQVIDLIR